MKADKIIGYSAAVVLVGGAIVGANYVLASIADQSARMDNIVKAQQMANFIAVDEASFGSGFRDTVQSCLKVQTDVTLPSATLQNYVLVFKEAIAIASADDYAPRKTERWFSEAYHKARSAHISADETLEGLKDAERKPIEAAISALEDNIDKVAACVVSKALEQA